MAKVLSADQQAKYEEMRREERGGRGGGRQGGRGEGRQADNSGPR
jgi:hypothetical protein